LRVYLLQKMYRQEEEFIFLNLLVFILHGQLSSRIKPLITPYEPPIKSMFLLNSRGPKERDAIDQ
jgi:hypothetical protein